MYFFYNCKDTIFLKQTNYYIVFKCFLFLKFGGCSLLFFELGQKNMGNVMCG